PTDEVILKEGNDGYFSTLPIRDMVNQLQASGFPAAISNSAGTYLCNNVMYMALYFAHEFQPNMKCGFIHIPASHELAIQHGGIPSWSHEDLKKSVSICIEALSSDE
ncbi:hypothetical protein J4G37_55005, partial [Microvirga sp. 3-52]|nr:hypothetical protein [Microvirga sp. 3-52]